MLLQLSLCVVTVIQLTSSQSTYDVIQQENDVGSCECTEHVLNKLMTISSQLQIAVSQLQKDAAELKTATVPKIITGTLRNQTGESRYEAAQKVN